jgi:tetrapyrrole methylase family protein/MazG family protein
VRDSAEVRRNWAKIKRAEKSPDENTALLDHIPHATAALKRAHRVLEAVAALECDPPSEEDIWQRIDAAAAACRRSLRQGLSQAAQIAYGDLLWALAALGPAVGVEPHKALSDALDRFEDRVRDLEEEFGAGRLSAGAFSSDESEKIKQLFE